MNTAEEIKTLVREKYGQIAEQSREENAASCCGAGGCSTVDYTIMSEDYSATDGYVPDADLGLGCGIPTEFAQIKKGDVVLDLGSGAGNDAFVARALVGTSGKVIGVDMTASMIDKARKNNDTLGFNNVEFRLGEIEHLPIGSNMVDVIVSNCVLNLVPNKNQAFAEMFRVLRPGGRVAVLEFAIPTTPGVRAAYLWYFNRVLPMIGKIISKHNAAYGYLPASVGAFATPDEFVTILRQRGFVDVRAVSLTFGIVYLYTATRP